MQVVPPPIEGGGPVAKSPTVHDEWIASSDLLCCSIVVVAAR